MRRRSASVALAVLLASCGGGGDHGPGSPPAGGKVGHVFIIVLENKSFAETFAQDSPAPYLAQALVSQGAFLTQYYATGHVSLDNYITMASGQAPNAITQSDCQVYLDWLGSSALDSDGQVTGQGCVYPSTVKTIGNQLTDAGLTWRGYMEDMGNDLSRDGTATCSHPALNAQDPTQSAAANDQYATRHNPFVYFHAVIDDQAYCDEHVVPLTQLAADLGSDATTPNYVFITPNLCNDGHDTGCANGDPGGLVSINTFLQTWVPQIVNSAAFRKDGLLIVTFDEADVGANTDASACCNEPTGLNTPMPGIFGPGGGRVGAVLLSPFITPGTVSETPYNHYSLLRSVEDVFGLDHLGYAGQDGLQPFGADIFGANAN